MAALAGDVESFCQALFVSWFSRWVVDTRFGDFAGVVVCLIEGGWLVGKRDGIANGSVHEHVSLRRISKSSRARSAAGMT